MRRLLLATEILSLATQVYRDQLDSFLITPRRDLGMRTPREAVVDGDLDAVRQLLIDSLEGHWA